mgnify:FL=1
MRVAVLCEFSGTVRDAFRRLGHEAVGANKDCRRSGGSHPQNESDKGPLEAEKFNVSRYRRSNGDAMGFIIQE